MRISLFALGFAAIALGLFTYTIGQWLPVEFADQEIKCGFYDALVFAVPIGILFPLFFTLRRGQRNGLKVGIITATCAVAFVSFVFSSLMSVVNSFCTWSEGEIFYERSVGQKVPFREQCKDCGVVSGECRIVQIQPLMNYWNIVTEVPADSIDWSEWR